MNNKKISNYPDIILYPKDSFEDLVLRGFHKKEIEEITGCKFPSDFSYRQKLSVIKESDLFKYNQKTYKLKYIRENFSNKEVLTFFKSLSSSKITQEHYLHFGVRKGNRPNHLLASDIFDFLGMNAEFLELIKFYYQKTSLQNYGTKFPQSSEVVKSKMKQTFINNYGVENPFQSELIKDKIKQTNREKYGVDWYTQTEELKERRESFWLENFGVKTNLQLEECKEKIKKTNLSRYGAENPIKSEAVRSFYLEKYGNEYPMKATKPADGEVLTPIQKAIQTKRVNKSLNTSSEEQQLLKILNNNFTNVEQNYDKDSRYPFSVDFFIKDLDLFVELNLHWTHCGHFFDKNSPEDMQILNNMKEKSNGSEYYANAIQVWTQRDQKKREMAKKNNLNYVVLWSQQDIKDWINAGFPIRKDY